jgi:hypothetical protein
LVVHHLVEVSESDEGGGADADEREVPSALTIAAGEQEGDASSRAEQLVAVAFAADEEEAAAPGRERQGDSGWR